MKKSLKNFSASRMLFLVAYLFISTFSLRAQNVTVSGALSGNGSYPDLKDAFTAINLGVQTSANITVSILANTTETASAVLNAGAWTSMLIVPTGNFIVSGNLNAPLVDFNGADNVTIDGINSGASALTISNSNTGNTNACALRFINDANSNLVTNCTLLGSGTAVTLGVVLFSTGSSTGNSSNTITACSVGVAGSNLPVNCIYSSGSAAANNINNTISNCSVSDYFSSSLVSTGILLGPNNSGWNISDNRLFQSSSRTYGTANTHRGIQITSGSSHNVLNNVVGYASSTGSGVYTMVSTVATRFIAIDLGLAATGISSIQGNTVTAITLTTSSNASTANGIICGINITSGNANIGNLSGNQVGGTTGVNHIAGQPTAAQGMVVGIHSSSTGTIAIQNNYIGGISSSGTTAAISGGAAGINITGLATGLTITGNTIGNGTADNIRGGTSGLTTGTSPVSGIYISASLATPLVTISSNTIQNLSSFSSGTGSYVRGFWMGTGASASTFLISNNVFLNLKSNNANITVSNGQVGTAAIIFASGVTSTISGNYIDNVSNINGGTTAIVAAGITHANATNSIIRGNRIYNIINTGTSTNANGPCVATGIMIRSGTNDLKVYNNMISLGNGQTSNTAFVGIWGNHASAPNPNDLIYFNTINIEGTVTSGAQPSFGFLRGDFTTLTRTAYVDLRNNIITNTRSGGTGVHCALGNNYGIAASGTGWGALSSNYNVLNANSSTIGWWNTVQTYTGWKLASGCDLTGFSGIAVNYVNSANDLHLNMGLTPTYIESGGQTISGINTDIDNQVRPGPVGSSNGGALFPDIGADEIDGVVLYCNSANGGVISPSSYTACSEQILSAIALNTSFGLGTSYQWQVGITPGGPYSNITSGLGMTTVSHTSSPLPTGVYYVVLRTTCANASLTGVSNEVTLTVNPTPTVTGSSSTPVICSGASISLSGSPGTGTSYDWTGPNGFTSASQNTVISNATIDASGKYYFTSALNGCTSEPAVVSVTVNATPTTLTFSPATTTVCAGNSQTITVTGGNVPGGAFSFTPNTNQNTPTTYPAPYSIYWGGQKMQFLVLASELTAAGLVAGPLTELHLPVASLGSNWGVSTFACEDFQVSIGHTALTSLGATFQTGLTVVSAASNYSPVVGYNVHSFSPTFAWDGVSNIIIETVFSNNLTGAQQDAVISYNSPTPFQSTMIYRADGQNFATVAAATTTNEPTNLVRPDFILKGQTLGSYTWSPATGLSATTGSAVGASPSSTSVYTVMVSTGICSTSASTTVDVIPMPTLSIVPSSTAICNGSSATLTASGATNVIWSTASTNTAVVVAPTQNTVYTVANQTAPCPITTASIALVVNPAPVITAQASPSTICAGYPSTLSASGGTAYLWSTNGTSVTEVVNPMANTVYSVTGTGAFGCSIHSVISICA